MRFLFLFSLLALPMFAQTGQIPQPQVPVTGSIGVGGIFPLFNHGTIVLPGDANYTMSYPDMSAVNIVVTSSVALTATRSIIVPLNPGFAFTIENRTTGGKPIYVVGPSGIGITISNGKAQTIVSNGTNFVRAVGTEPINALTDCGLKGDGVTNDGLAFQACIDAHPGRQILLPKTQGPSVGGAGLPLVDYYFGSTTIILRGGNGTWILGDVNTKWLSGSTIAWDANTTGFEIDGNCAGCRLSHLGLTGPRSQCWLSNDTSTWGNFGSWPGIYDLAGETRMDDINIRCFNGDGIWIRGNVANQTLPGPVIGGQPDLWRLDQITTFDNHGNGIKVEGGDSNVGFADGTNNFGNELWGINERSALGNVYLAPHTNYNGNNGGFGGGINSRKFETIQRISGVVTACPLTNVSGFAVGNQLVVDNSTADPSLNGIPLTITAVSAGATDACIVAGDTNPRGWVQWNQAGPDMLLASSGVPSGTYLGAMGIVSSISTGSLTGGTLTITASAPSTTLASDISVAGRWIKIMGTGTVLDNHIFRPTTVTNSGTNTVTVTLPLLGVPTPLTPSTSQTLTASVPSVTTGYLFSAYSTSIIGLNPYDAPIRTVTDAAITAPASPPATCSLTTCLLNSVTAQFQPIQGPITPPTGVLTVGQPVAVAGAGPGGSTLFAHVQQVTNSASVVLDTPASVTVANAQADFGGGWGGGAYLSWSQATPSVWINPYAEATQRPQPMNFNLNSIVIGSNVSFGTTPSDVYALWDSSNGTAAIPGVPTNLLSGTMVSPSGFSFKTYSDNYTNFTWKAGRTKDVAINFVTEGHTNQLKNYLYKEYTSGDMSYGNDDIYITKGGPIYIRNSTSVGQPIDIGGPYDGQSDIAFYGYCSTTGLAAGANFFIDHAGAFIKATPPCTATSTSGNVNSIPLQLLATFYGTTAAGTTIWQIQSTFPSGNSPRTNPLRIAPNNLGGYGIGLGGFYPLSTTFIESDPYTFANLASMVTAGVAEGAQVFCSNCGPTTAASCSTANPAACVCTTNATSSMFVKYENFMGNGLNWYCH